MTEKGWAYGPAWSPDREPLAADDAENANAHWVSRFKCNICGLDWAEFWEEIRDGEWAHWCRTVMEEHSNSGFHLIEAGKRAKAWTGPEEDEKVDLSKDIPHIPEYPFRVGELRIGFSAVREREAQADAWLEEQHRRDEAADAQRRTGLFVSKATGDLSYQFHPDGPATVLARGGKLMGDAIARKKVKMEQKMLARLQETEPQRLLRLWQRAVRREKKAHNAYINCINRAGECINDERHS